MVNANNVSSDNEKSGGNSTIQTEVPDSGIDPGTIMDLNLGIDESKVLKKIDSEDDEDDEPENNHEHDHDEICNKRPAIFKSTFVEVTCILILTLAPAIGTISVGAVQIGLEDMGVAFDINLETESGTLSWSIAAFSLTTGSFLLFFGGLADIFGRRIIVLISYIWYAVFCLISGFMHNFVAFCIMRALQGIAGAAAVPAAVGILGVAYKPGTRKNRAMAMFASGAPVGFIIGIIAGGISTQFLSFRAVLYFFAIIYSLAGVVAFFVIPKTDHDHLDWAKAKEGLKTLDYGGTFLTVAGFTLFVFALTQSESAPQGWSTPYIIALLVVGVLLIVAFVVYEAYVPQRPLMPMALWTTSRQFPICMLIMSASWMNFTGTLAYYGTLYFQLIRKASPILTTAYWVPQAIAGILVNVIVAFTLHRIPGHFLMFIATLGFTGAALLWAFIPIDIIYWAMPFPAMILSVVGADISYNVANMLTLTSVPKSMQSSAAGVFNTCLQLSTAIGLAASSVVVSSIASRKPQPLSLPDKLASYHGGFYFAVGVAGFSLICSLFLRVGTHGRKKPAKVE